MTVLGGVTTEAVGPKVTVWAIMVKVDPLCTLISPTKSLLLNDGTDDPRSSKPNVNAQGKPT
jgi:hypothetical protein